MSRFTKSKSLKLLNTQPKVNIIALKHNSAVLGLNRVYSQPSQDDTAITDQVEDNSTINNIVIKIDEDPELLNSSDIQNELLLEWIYPPSDNIEDINPLKKRNIPVSKINFGNSLDYLYKKQQFKNGK